MPRLLFTTSNAWVSKVIRWFTKSKVSHVGVELEKGQILAAEASGVKILTRDQFLRGRRTLVIFDVTSKGEALLDIEHAKSHIGMAYDFLALFGFAWIIAFKRWLHWKIKNPLASANKTVCSEFILHMDHEKRINAFKYLDPETTDPQILLDSILKNLQSKEDDGVFKLSYLKL